MNLTISGHHLDVSPALRAYVLAKLDRVLRHVDQVIHVKVLLSTHNEAQKDGRQRAECSILVKGNALHAGGIVGRSRRADRCQPLHLPGLQPQIRRAEIVGELRRRAGPENDRGDGRPRRQPGERHLRHRHATALRHLLDRPDDRPGARLGVARAVGLHAAVGVLAEAGGAVAALHIG